MDYSQWQQPPVPAIQPPEINQSTAVDAYYTYYTNPNPNSISNLQTNESSAITIPPPPGVVDPTTASYVMLDTTPYYTLDTNTQNLAWQDAVHIYGTDPIAISGTVSCFKNLNILDDTNCVKMMSFYGFLDKVMSFGTVSS